MANVTINLTNVLHALGTLKDQLPYAAMLGINNILVDVQAAEREHIKQVFTVRRPSFIDNSVKIQFAKKTQLRGSVRIGDLGGKSTADILSKFESGEVKVPRGKNVAIPTSNVKTNKSGIITSSKRPSNLKNSFKMQTGGKEFIVVAKRKKGKDQLTFMYLLKPSVRIDNRLNFTQVGIMKVNQVAQQRMNEAIQKAIATAGLKK